MKNLFFFPLLLSSIITSSLFSQSTGTLQRSPYGPTEEIKKGEAWHYARKIVDTMASESMHGRGYVNDGDKIAANYIRTEFKKFGLKSFSDDYYQKFNLGINTFPNENLAGNLFYILPTEEKSTLQNTYFGRAGKNFLFEASSPNSHNELYIRIVDSTDVSSSLRVKKLIKELKKLHFDSDMIYLLIDDRGIKDQNKIARIKTLKENKYELGGIITLVPKLTWSQSQVESKFSKIQILSDSFNLKEKRYYGDIQLTTKFIPNYQSQNVISYVQGSIYPDSFIVFSAHYDHLGQMGKDVYFPGANDNASGCAMLLNLAKHYSKPENKPKCSIAFIAFGAEEVGLIGSKYFTEHPLIPLKNIKFLLNMDIMGTGEEGITVVNGSVFKPEFEKLKQINTENNFIKDVKIRGKAANSDHYFFSENGVKAFFIYTMGGIKAYHDIYDRPETLPLNEFEDLFKMIIKFSTYLQN